MGQLWKSKGEPKSILWNRNGRSGKLWSYEPMGNSISCVFPMVGDSIPEPAVSIWIEWMQRKPSVRIPTTIPMVDKESVQG